MTGRARGGGQAQPGEAQPGEAQQLSLFDEPPAGQSEDPGRREPDQPAPEPSPGQLSLFPELVRPVPPPSPAVGEPPAAGAGASAAPARAAQAPAPDEPPPRASERLAGARDLESLRALALACARCRLRDGCRGVVFGEGPERPEVVLVGEGPGAVEDEQGRPFVGPAGQLLDKILAAAGFRRDEVYITNVVMCRPPGNRTPLPDEVAACYPWLVHKLRLLRPRVIVALGAAAAQTLLGPAVRISRARGAWFEREGVKMLPTFHPAALLRDPSKKYAVWTDFQALRRMVDQLRAEKAPPA